MSTTATGADRPGRASDDEVLAARLAWLRRTRSEEEARLVESALLARTDNGVHAGDPGGGDR